uniref:NADH-ubiquinone oxidoreductase chain 6 n=1 Tax=Tetartopeus terminatum TaxID=879056 RepID=A0A0S2M936_TETTM|nr:NADH dehydrogenase subunit 6 [Tetartopeus terminatus]ALO71199.1 NADH deshydrogenase subunit 6 [Tetartopeus terminatus]
MLMMMSMMMSMMFLFMKHPLSMGFILLLQTITITMITGLISFNFWFSYILFLIMIGGMLVLFIYMTSIASNEYFKYSNSLLLMMIITMMTTIYLYFTYDKMIMNYLNMNQDFLNNYNFYLSMSKFINYPSNLIMFLMIIYLFITLIAVVKICKINMGPLRQSF